MQPSQADVVAACSALIDTLSRQREYLLRQTEALNDAATGLDSITEERGYTRDMALLANSASRFLRAHALTQAETAASMESAIAHNQRVLDMARSNIVIPGLQPKFHKA